MPKLIEPATVLRSYLTNNADTVFWDTVDAINFRRRYSEIKSVGNYGYNENAFLVERNNAAVDRMCSQCILNFSL